MARYKHIDANPRFLPIDLSRQLLPGTFVHALNHLLDQEIDLSSLGARFRNDDTGAPAYPPALLLKVILFGYSQGIVSSRAPMATAPRWPPSKVSFKAMPVWPLSTATIK